MPALAGYGRSRHVGSGSEGLGSLCKQEYHRRSVWLGV